MRSGLTLKGYVHFWGVRGSIPTPAPVGGDVARVGGNTSCIELNPGGESLFILDAGTGIRLLGLDILGRDQKPTHIHLFITHTHWDHVQGFPFFVPAYIPGNNITIYGVDQVGKSLEEVIEGQQRYQFFPVALNQMMAKISFRPIGKNDEITVDGITIKTAPMHHPHPATVGYRFSTPDWAITLSTDTEHIPGETDENVLKLAHETDILIYDSQYTTEEFPSKLNWGHSTWEEAVRLAELANVKKLVLFHHEPTRGDKEILETATRASRIFPDCLSATEGLRLPLSTRQILPQQQADQQ